MGAGGRKIPGRETYKRVRTHPKVTPPHELHPGLILQVWVETDFLLANSRWKSDGLSLL